MTTAESPDLLELEVGAIAAGGGCVARAPDGKVVFVRHSLPGERVRAQVTSSTSSYLRADAVEILTPSPDRVEPPCPHAGPGRCGGCDFQHVEIGAQRRLKAFRIAEQLERLAGLDLAVEVEPVPGDTAGLGYRSRVRVAVDGRGAVGFRRHRSHRIEYVHECPIASPAVTATGALSVLWPGATELEVVTGTGPGARRWSRSRRGAAPRRACPTSAPASWSAGRSAVLPAPCMPSCAAAPTGFRPGSSGRSTPARRRRSSTRSWTSSGRARGRRWWTSTPAPASSRSPWRTRWARRARSSPSRGTGAPAPTPATTAPPSPTLRVLEGEVTPALVESALGRPDIVVLDPSREGAGTGVMRALAARTPAVRTVIYVSCDPSSFGRDSRVLLDEGWRLRGLRAFDIFPMTEHVELVAALEPPPADRR